MDDLEYMIISVDEGSLQDRLRAGLNRARAEKAFEKDIGGLILGGEELVARGGEDPSLESLSVNEEALNDRAALDEQRDPKQFVIPVMPLALIEPVAKTAAAGEDPLANARAAAASWGLAAVGADRTQTSGSGVKVAVLDTGIDPNHPAFAGVDLKRRNFSSNRQQDPDGIDGHGHGTHCAGTIFGRDVDGVRIGVARGVESALIAKVFDDKGHGNGAAVLSGLKWAQEEGANVVSISLGFDFPALQEQLLKSGRPPRLATSIALKAYRENLEVFRTLISHMLVETAISPGMVVVAASGNESERDTNPNFVIDVSVPAATSPDILSVGAAERLEDPSKGRYSIASFSNINPRLSAPGVDIVSAGPRGTLLALSGTSMACPHVAGVAALYWEWSTRNIGRATGMGVRGLVIGNADPTPYVPTVTHVDRGAGMARAPA